MNKIHMLIDENTNQVVAVGTFEQCFAAMEKNSHRRLVIKRVTTFDDGVTSSECVVATNHFGPQVTRAHSTLNG